MITFIYGKLLYSYRLYAKTNQKSSKLKFIDHFFASYGVDSKRRKSLYADTFFFCFIPRKDCLQSAFSCKIRLVLISASAIGNHDVMLTIREPYFCFPGLRPRLSRLACLALVNLQRIIRDAVSQSVPRNIVT